MFHRNVLDTLLDVATANEWGTHFEVNEYYVLAFVCIAAAALVFFSPLISLSVALHITVS